MANLTSAQIEQQFVQASKVGVPIIGISTADQRATAKKLITALSASKEEKPFSFLVWNCLDGVTSAVTKNDKDFEGSESLHKNAENAIRNLIATQDKKSDEFEDNSDNDSILPDITEMLQSIRKNLPERSVVFVQNIHLFFDSNTVLQGIWNLRKAFKSNRRMLVLLAPDFKSPPELKDDIVTYDDPLPTEQEIAAIVRKIEKPLQIKEGSLDPAVVEKCTDCVLGLSGFAAEQALFLSLKREGEKINIDFNQLRHVKRTLIRQTPGLRVSEDGFRFDDIGGVPFIKEFMTGVIKGRKPPKLIVFVDEIEKAMASSTGGDNTGVSQDMLGQMLQHMENTHARGSIFVGPPGCSKTMIARAIGNEAGIDTVEFDLGAVKQGEVGSSERNIRQALKVIGSCSRESSYWIATSNNLSVIPAELRRRYTDGIWYFDLPTQDEVKAIWDIQIKANNLDKKQYKNRPNDKGWTGAEIRNCCAMAYDRCLTIEEAAKYINPVSISSADLIRQLRKSASGKFMSASYEGVYRYETKEQETDERDISI